MFFLKLYSLTSSYSTVYISRHRRCSTKKVLLNISQNSQENTCLSLFFNKVAGRSTGEVRDSGTGVFL